MRSCTDIFEMDNPSDLAPASCFKSFSFGDIYDFRVEFKNLCKATDTLIFECINAEIKCLFAVYRKNVLKMFYMKIDTIIIHEWGFRIHLTSPLKFTKMLYLLNFYKRWLQPLHCHKCFLSQVFKCGKGMEKGEVYPHCNLFLNLNNTFCCLNLISISPLIPKNI